MPVFDVEFEVYCSCGEGLCNQSTPDSGRRGLRVTVEPCKRCLSKAKDEGHDEGYAEGQSEGE